MKELGADLQCAEVTGVCEGSFDDGCDVDGWTASAAKNRVVV